MLDIPVSLEESAEIDGAGYFTIFVKIISPLCKPVYATIALFVAVWQWNDWLVTKFYIIDVKKRDALTVLQYQLMKLLDTTTTTTNNPNINTKTGSTREWLNG